MRSCTPFGLVSHLPAYSSEELVIKYFKTYCAETERSVFDIIQRFNEKRGIFLFFLVSCLHFKIPNSMRDNILISKTKKKC